MTALKGLVARHPSVKAIEIKSRRRLDDDPIPVLPRAS
jgi:hypothetical protein